jgi:hypothetical protein
VTATAADQTDKPRLLCSFCGKSNLDVHRLIAGPGVYICDECIGLCNQILVAEDAEPSGERYGPFKNWDDSSDTAMLEEMVRIHSSHDQVDASVTAMVRLLRERDVTWARIGEALGMTRQSAWERFSGEE